MTEKSHVSMEQAVCPACGVTEDTGAILLDKRMRQSLDRNTVTGWGLCQACKDKIDSGWIVLVAIDPAKSGGPQGGTVKPEDAYRTGAVAYLKAAAFAEVFNVPAPPKGVCFCESAVLDQLAASVARPA